MDEPVEQDAALLRVVRGRPSAEELAAVLVVLRARATAEPDRGPTAPAAGWNAYGRGVRRPLVPGPGAWQAAARW